MPGKKPVKKRRWRADDGTVWETILGDQRRRDPKKPKANTPGAGGDKGAKGGKNDADMSPVKPGRARSAGDGAHDKSNPGSRGGTKPPKKQNGLAQENVEANPTAASQKEGTQERARYTLLKKQAAALATALELADGELYASLSAASSQLEVKLEAAKQACTAADPARRRQALQRQTTAVEKKLDKNKELLAEAEAAATRYREYVASQESKLAKLRSELQSIPASEVALASDAGPEAVLQQRVRQAQKELFDFRLARKSAEAPPPPPADTSAPDLLLLDPGTLAAATPSNAGVRAAEVAGAAPDENDVPLSGSDSEDENAHLDGDRASKAALRKQRARGDGIKKTRHRDLGGFPLVKAAPIK